MAKYVFVYHGGKPGPDRDMEQVMTEWNAWFESMGNALVDKGCGVGMSTTVTADGIIDNGGANPISGVSIIEVDSLDAAHTIAKQSPIFKDGGTIEVAPAMEM